MKLLIFAISIFLNFCFADENAKREREILLENVRLQDIPRNEIYKFPELYQYNEGLLKDFNTSDGTFSDTYYTQLDTGKLALSYSSSVNIDNLGELKSLDVSYLRTFENSWREYWWGLQFKYTQVEVEVVSDTLSSTTSDNQDFIFLAFGLAHRFKSIAHVFNSDRVFEMVNYYVGLVQHKDNLQDENNTGIGQNIEYCVSVRSSKDFFWGGKISYTWALVEHAQKNDEKLSERSNTFGWTSIGFEMGYIF